MLDLSPTKLLIIFVVGVVLLGPKRLPTLARQAGAGWRRLREMHTKLDTEVRQALPDLPSSQQIARFARSPVSLLDRLADMPAKGADGTPATAAGATAAGATGTVAAQEPGPGAGTGPVLADDPSLN